MALLTFDTITFLEINQLVVPSDKKGKVAVKLSDFNQSNQVAISKIISVIKPDFEPNNLFAVEVDYGMVMRLLGFSLALQDDKLCLLFGSLTDEPKCNMVEVQYKNGKLLAGNAKILISATDPTKENSEANFMLSLETQKADGGTEKWRIPLYGHLKDGVSYDTLEECSSLEEFASQFKPFGGLGCKLVDFVRPFIGSAKAARNRLPKPIILRITAWDIKEPPADNPEYGESVLFSLDSATVPKAQLEDGTIIEKPSGVYINAKRPGLGMAAQMMMNPDYAGAAMKHLENGGIIELWITEVNANEPGRKMPRHQLRMVPLTNGSTAAIAPGSTPAVDVAAKAVTEFSTVVNHASNGKTPLEAVPVAVGASSTGTDDDDEDIPPSFGSFS